MKNKNAIVLIVIISLIVLGIGISITINTVEKGKVEKSEIEKIEEGKAILGSEVCDGKRGHSFLAGQAITSWKCKICGYLGTYPDTGVPTICGECARITGRCTKCGRIK